MTWLRAASAEAAARGVSHAAQARINLAIVFASDWATISAAQAVPVLCKAVAHSPHLAARLDMLLSALQPLQRACSPTTNASELAWLAAAVRAVVAAAQLASAEPPTQTSKLLAVLPSLRACTDAIAYLATCAARAKCMPAVQACAAAAREIHAAAAPLALPKPVVAWLHQAKSALALTPEEVSGVAAWLAVLAPEPTADSKVAAAPASISLLLSGQRVPAADFASGLAIAQRSFSSKGMAAAGDGAAGDDEQLFFLDVGEQQPGANTAAAAEEDAQPTDAATALHGISAAIASAAQAGNSDDERYQDSDADDEAEAAVPASAADQTEVAAADVSALLDEAAHAGESDEAGAAPELAVDSPVPSPPQPSPPATRTRSRRAARRS